MKKKMMDYNSKRSLLSNINKLSKFGSSKTAYSKDKSLKVVIAREADHRHGINRHLKRLGYGTRRFRVFGGESYGLRTKTPSGKSYTEYTLGQIRAALMA